MLKNFKHSETGLADDDDEAFEASKGDNVNDIIEANIVATSTPQKIAAKQVGCSGDIERYLIKLFLNKHITLKLSYYISFYYHLF